MRSEHWHDALYDARNTAELFAVVRNGEQCSQALKIVMEALKPKKLGNTLGDLFDFNVLREQLV